MKEIEAEAPNVVKVSPKETDFLCPREAREFLRGWLRCKLSDADYASLDMEDQGTSVRKAPPKDTIFDNGVVKVRLRKIPTVDIKADPETNTKAEHIKAHWEIDVPSGKTITAQDSKDALNEVALVLARVSIRPTIERVTLTPQDMKKLEAIKKLMKEE